MSLAAITKYRQFFSRTDRGAKSEKFNKFKFIFAETLDRLWVQFRMIYRAERFLVHVSAVNSTQLSDDFFCLRSHKSREFLFSIEKYFLSEIIFSGFHATIFSSLNEEFARQTGVSLSACEDVYNPDSTAFQIFYATFEENLDCARQTTFVKFYANFV